tara:strand:- start:8305 stop:9309 length:1005 start_codon:yes stop_codon:yes gene_type:complete
VIAEIGVNHEGSLSKAKRLIDAAAQAGAHAAKFQTYKAENLASVNSKAYWDTKLEKTKSQYQLFKKYDSFNEKEYIKLSLHCKKRKIDFLSTPFDINSVNFLNPIMKYYKIASADITNLPLIEAIAKKRKPVLLSTGASKISEIKFAVNFLKKKGCPNVSILHCILNYPTNYENANLNMIKSLSKNFPDLTIGYSDHTLPDNSMLTLVSSFLKGARIIEKHFTDNKKLKGNDHYHAMDSKDLKVFFNSLDKLDSISGLNKKKPLKTEKISIKNARRSVIINFDLEKGVKINKSMITTKRPGTGISPIYFKKVIGKYLKYKLKKDHILKWKDLTN